ncbi:MAG: YIP1 family protein [Thermomicrobiales bacterium]
MRAALQQSFWDRIVGVATLQRPVYDAIARDSEATGQAWLIVILLGLANGIALITTTLTDPFPGVSGDIAAETESMVIMFDTTERRILAFGLGILAAIISWYLTSWLLRLIGTWMSTASRSDLNSEEMRRLVAWGYSPSLATFLTPIPLVGPFLAVIGSIWALVTGVMVVRVAFGVSIGRAILIEIVTALALVVLAIVIAIIVVLLATLFGA